MEGGNRRVRGEGKAMVGRGRVGDNMEIALREGRGGRETAE